MQSWYLIYCKRGQLTRAQQHLHNQQVTSFSPIIELEKMVRGKRQIVHEPLFTNYLFIQFDPQEIHTTTISATRGVSHFVRFGASPAQVPEEIIEILQKNPPLSQVDPSIPNPGDKVEINEGILQGLTAIYAEPDGETRSILLINIMNRETRQSISNLEFSKL
ncbi:MAG: transcription/translation regulatory transformer protein RfaH [Enterobacteriaceae bacterium]